MKRHLQLAPGAVGAGGWGEASYSLTFMVSVSSELSFRSGSAGRSQASLPDARAAPQLRARSHSALPSFNPELNISERRSGWV